MFLSAWSWSRSVTCAARRQPRSRLRGNRAPPRACPPGSSCWPAATSSMPSRIWRAGNSSGSCSGFIATRAGGPRSCRRAAPAVARGSSPPARRTAPTRIGMSVVRLEEVEGLILHVRDADMLDGTPVLDLKPYVAYTDAHPGAGNGWLSDALPGGGAAAGRPRAGVHGAVRAAGAAARPNGSRLTRAWPSRSASAPHLRSGPHPIPTAGSGAAARACSSR